MLAFLKNLVKFIPNLAGAYAQKAFWQSSEGAALLGVLGVKLGEFFHWGPASNFETVVWPSVTYIVLRIVSKGLAKPA